MASRGHYLKLCLVYQVVNRHLNFPIVPGNLSRSLRNTSKLALERPITYNEYLLIVIFAVYNCP